MFSSPPGTAPHRQEGYTLAEMMVVIGIIALVAGMSVPMLTPYFRGRSVRDGADLFLHACISARSTAIQENVDQDVLIVATGESHTVQVLAAPQLDAPLVVTLAGTQKVTCNDATWEDGEYNGYFVAVVESKWDAGKSLAKGQLLRINTTVKADKQLTLSEDWKVRPAPGNRIQIYRSVGRVLRLPMRCRFDLFDATVLPGDDYDADKEHDSARLTFKPGGSLLTSTPVTSDGEAFSIIDRKGKRAKKSERWQACESGRTVSVFKGTGRVLIGEKDVGAQ